MYQYLNGSIKHELPSSTMIGAMANYISDSNIKQLVPMNANFGIIKSDYTGNKADKKKYYVENSLAIIKEYGKHV